MKGQTMKYATLIAVMILTLCLPVLADSQNYTTLPTLPSLTSPQPPASTYRQRLDSLFQSPTPRPSAIPSYTDIMRRNNRALSRPLTPFQQKLKERLPSLYQPVPTPSYRTAPTRYPDWRDYTKDFGMPEWLRDDLDRGNRAIERNFYLSTGCHKYNKACLNELLSLGGD